MPRACNAVIGFNAYYISVVSRICSHCCSGYKHIIQDKTKYTVAKSSIEKLYRLQIVKSREDYPKTRTMETRYTSILH